jgi:hypothetical protein
MKGKINQKEISILNTYAPNTGVPSILKNKTKQNSNRPNSIGR